VLVEDYFLLTIIVELDCYKFTAPVLL